MQVIGTVFANLEAAAVYATDCCLRFLFLVENFNRHVLEIFIIVVLDPVLDDDGISLLVVANPHELFLT